jgi:hypothetical protein
MLRACASIATGVGMSCAASHCDVEMTVVAQVALVKISCEMRDGGVDGESANSRRVLESLVFRPILPGPPPLGVHLFASMETLV